MTRFWAEHESGVSQTGWTDVHWFIYSVSWNQEKEQGNKTKESNQTTFCLQWSDWIHSSGTDETINLLTWNQYPDWWLMLQTFIESVGEHDPPSSVERTNVQKLIGNKPDCDTVCAPAQVMMCVLSLPVSWVISTAADVSGCRASDVNEVCSRSPSDVTETCSCSAAERCTLRQVSPAAADSHLNLFTSFGDFSVSAGLKFTLTKHQMQLGGNTHVCSSTV